ncbi:MAG: MBL fold metallo-hydrolase [Bacteroidales bacterium]|nr:MBL fold metallo-hydrolase [Bacteroidales bacterium]
MTVSTEINKNIYLLKIPTPFFVGPVNTYLIREDPITLIDTGPKTDEARDALLQGFKEVRVSVNDIKRVVLTHCHSDHFGNARFVQEASDSEVILNEGDSHYIMGSYDDVVKRWRDGVNTFFVESGVDKKEADELSVHFGSQLKKFGDSLERATFVQEGFFIKTDSYNLKVLHTPGHSPGSISLYSGENGFVFSGDTVLEGITPNPVAEVMDGYMEFNNLEAYRNSLEKVLALDFLSVLPGHGSPFNKDIKILEKRKKEEEKRQLKILEALNSSEKNYLQLAEILFGKQGVGGIFLALSEVSAHSRVLISKRKIQRKIKDDGVWYLKNSEE